MWAREDCTANFPLGGSNIAWLAKCLRASTSHLNRGLSRVKTVTDDGVGECFATYQVYEAPPLHMVVTSPTASTGIPSSGNSTGSESAIR